MRVALELFSGTCRLTQALRRHGLSVLAWDISLGPEYDLLKRSKRMLILGWFRSGFIACVRLGTPCGTFSRIRDRPNGPPGLRSDSYPVGLPQLTPRAQLEVKVGNTVPNCPPLYCQPATVHERQPHLRIRRKVEFG